MTMNNLVEISGTGSIVLKPLADFTVNETLYKAHELFYAQDGCQVQFMYSNVMRKANQGQINLLAEHALSLQQLVVSYLPLTTKILSFYKNKHTGGVRCPVVETSVAGPGLIMLRKIPLEGTIEVMDDSAAFTYDENYNAIVSDDFEEGQNYTVYYEIEQNVSTFNLNDYSPDFPYFSVDILMKGNFNKETRDFHIHIPRAAVQLSPAMGLINDVISSATMTLYPLDTEVLLTMVI